MASSGLKPILYAADVSPLEDECLYAAAYATVPPGRRKKADRFRFPKDKRLCLGAELLLRHGLREAGLRELPDDFAFGAQEKPYLVECGTFFNISHSGNWAVCAVGGFELGCDVEETRPIDLRLARRFHPDEYADILAQPSEPERLKLFYRYWTLKESFMKATGLGMALPLDAFRIVRGEQISVVQSVDEREYTFREFDGLPDCRCVICGAGDCRDAEMHIVSVGDLLPAEEEKGKE